MSRKMSRKKRLFASKGDSKEQKSEEPMNFFQTNFKEIDDLPHPKESCEELLETHIGKSYPDLTIDTIIEKSTKTAKKRWKEDNEWGVSFCEAMAIAAYTLDNVDDMYGIRKEEEEEEEEEENLRLYKVLNESLRKKEKEKLPNLKGYLYHLINGLKKLPPPNEKIMYRGMKINTDEDKKLLKSMKKGCSVNWTSFTSCSTDVEVAKDFAKESGVIFTISGTTNARVIKHFSRFQDENEIVYLPNSRFFIEKIEFPDSEGYIEIRLHELIGELVYNMNDKENESYTSSITGWFSSTRNNIFIVKSDGFKKSKVGRRNIRGRNIGGRKISRKI